MIFGLIQYLGHAGGHWLISRQRFFFGEGRFRNRRLRFLDL